MELVGCRNPRGHKKAGFFVESDGYRGALRLTSQFVTTSSAFSYFIRIVVQNNPLIYALSHPIAQHNFCT